MRKNTDLTKILNKSHENKWVALSPDQTRVVDSAVSLMDLKDKVKDKEVIYMKMLPSDTEFAF